MFDMRFSLGGGPGEDPGHAGGTISLGWPGNALGSPQKSWRERLVWAFRPRLLPPRPGPGKRKVMDGFFNFIFILYNKHQSTKANQPDYKSLETGVSSDLPFILQSKQSNTHVSTNLITNVNYKRIELSCADQTKSRRT